MLAGLLCAAHGRAQLAITEVMSWSVVNCAACEAAGPRGCHPDFWELTNFGTNAVELTGYRFWDSDPVPFELAHLLPCASIGPGESIVFVRTWPEVSDAAAFRQWWGDENLTADLQICFYPRNPGFDFLGDAVRVWDADTNLVDEVVFGESRNEATLDYDTETGAARQSTNGVCGALRATVCGDVGSPGRAPCGPVPLKISRQPVSQTVDAGGEVTFRVEATGLPRPRGLQWYFQEAPIARPPAGPDAVPTVVNYAGCGPAWTATPKPTDLTIHDVQTNHAGRYFAVFTNGLESLTSAVVTLTVNTSNAPPRIECPPAGLRWPALPGQSENTLVVTELQTATFDVVVRGYPMPTFRWSWSADGTRFTDLPGATNRTLTISFALSGHSGYYRVRAQNLLGTNHAFARLIVQAESDRPRLKITEAMSASCFVAEDWWELTNVGEKPANLYGYRWDENPGVIGGGPTITDNITIQPGESIIFLEGHTPEFFIHHWWGASNLPPGLQIITHTANGLLAEQDEINLWNPTEVDSAYWLDQVIFSAATPGASFWFAPNDPCSEFGVVSVEGECGAFRSIQGCDVGSPGWTAWSPPRLTSVRRVGEDVRLEWKAQPGSTNRVQYTARLASPPSATVWANLSPPLTTSTYLDNSGDGTPRRFYRVKQVAPKDCSCPTPAF
jgi:hypothetical protein